MSRTCTTADDAATRDATVTLRDCWPPAHVARGLADVLTPLALGALDAPEGPRGGEARAPARRVGLLGLSS